MKKIFLLLVVVFKVFTTNAQNIECAGNTITIPLTGYKTGTIQWQFSPNNTDWTNISNQATTTLQYTVSQTGYFRAKVTYGSCDYFSALTFINVYPVPTTPDAGADQYITGVDTMVTLSANTPVNGRGKWTIVSGDGGVLANDTLSNTTFKGKNCNDYVLRWTISTGCMVKSDEVKVGFHLTPTTANAGDDIVRSIDSVLNLSANIPIVGKGKWIVVLGIGGVFENDTIPNTKFYGNHFSKYELKWSVFSKCNPSSDNVMVSIDDKVIDIEGNIYPIVKIGNQIWMKENLKTTHFNYGINIPLTEDGNDWAVLNSSSYCWYNNDSVTFKKTYGALYNWYCVENQNICPVGWHVPSQDEWIILISSQGGFFKGDLISLRERGSIHWGINNIATNSTGFTALPGGSRSQSYYGSFFNIGSFGNFWSSSLTGMNNGYDDIYYVSIYKENVADWKSNKKMGYSIRCLKD